MEHSKYYKTFANILQIRTVSAEYLVAMKLMAGRQYKNDLSDIVGVLIEQEERNEPLLKLFIIKMIYMNFISSVERLNRKIKIL